ncbi:BLUF domain-containing protein [Variovorax sp. GT1P44]|uniref:BLUF domain-containing protein n=1 Tax=Variovorax sp. GT1P44 TaxID=3443742 RepID=UPI003F470B7B
MHLREILYSSLLAPHQPTAVVGQFVTRARLRNAENGITGLLVFDGMRFCQHFEGPAEQVAALMRLLEADRRHEEVNVLYEGPLQQRRYQRFELGFAEVDDHDDLADISVMRGAEALQRFLALRPRFDVSG